MSSWTIIIKMLVEMLRQTRFQSTLRVSSVTALLNAEQPPIPKCSHHEEPLSTASASNEERLFVMPDKDDTATSSADCLGPSNTTGSHQVNADLSRNLGMEMSCDVAATILANVQGQGDTSRARIDLGCTGHGVCAELYGPRPLGRGRVMLIPYNGSIFLTISPVHVITTPMP